MNMETYSPGNMTKLGFETLMKTRPPRDQVSIRFSSLPAVRGYSLYYYGYKFFKFTHNPYGLRVIPLLSCQHRQSQHTTSITHTQTQLLPHTNTHIDARRSNLSIPKLPPPGSVLKLPLRKFNVITPRNHWKTSTQTLC